MNKIAVVILNWNGKDLLKKFLPSVITHSKREWAEVIVADNASSDDSIEFLQKEYADVKCIALDKNYGFAEGYNRALKQLDHKYFVLLNSDIEVSENWLDPIYQLLEEDDSIAAVQPKIKAYRNKSEFEHAGASGGFIDFLGFPFCRGRIIDKIESDSGQYEERLDIFWASGAALFIRANLYNETGGLDPDFFAHMEEIDLCWRIKNRGYKIVAEPKSTVYHVGGATLPYNSPQKLHLNFRNNLFMMYKNLPSNKLNAILFRRMILDGVAALRFLFGGAFSSFTAVFNAHVSFYSNLSTLRRKRKALAYEVNKSDHKEIYKNSIIFDYYLRKKKNFSEIRF